MDSSTTTVLEPPRRDTPSFPLADAVDRVRADAAVEMAPAPIPDAWKLAGDPRPTVRYVSCASDGGILSGIWTCEPAVFRFDYTDYDETIHIISGLAEVRVGAEVLRLEPGSVAYFPRGSSAIWTVHEPIHKYFVIRNRSRVVRKLKRIAGRLSGASAVRAI